MNTRHRQKYTCPTCGHTRKTRRPGVCFVCGQGRSRKQYALFVKEVAVIEMRMSQHKDSPVAQMYAGDLAEARRRWLR